MDIICPNCMQTLEGDESLVGQMVECPGCGNSFVVAKQAGGSAQQESPAEEPQPVTDIKVVKSGRKNSRAKIGIAVAAAVACAVIAGYFLFLGNAGANAVKNDSSGFTQEEKRAMGKIMVTLAQFDSGMKNMTAQLTAESDGRTAEIMVSVSPLRMIDELENQDGWNECPQEYRVVMKDSYTAKVKRGISDVIEKYGRHAVLNLFDKFNLPAKYRRVCEEIADAGSVSIELEQIRAVKASQNFMAKYGLTDKDLMRFATEEFDRTSDPSGQSRGDGGNGRQLNADIFADELAAKFPHCTRPSRTIVKWDVGGESPPFICTVEFHCDGTATLTQDNTFFLQEQKIRNMPMYSVPGLLEASFSNLHSDKKNVENVKATIKDGHLYFRADTAVESGRVFDNVQRVFKMLNEARMMVRMLN